MSWTKFLTDDERAFREEARAFVANTITPRAVEIDQADDVPPEVLKALHPYLLTAIPTKYGGRGLGEVFDCLAVEEIGAACPALVPYLEVAQLFVKAILIAGTEEQKERYVVQLIFSVMQLRSKA